MKRAVCINDLSGFGKCSLTVALPIMSAMGVEVCPVPTAILSSHTGIEGYTFFDFSGHIPEFAGHLSKLDINIDAIYSGFLASSKQIDIVYDVYKLLGKSSLKLIDPVMGDNGRRYPTYTDEMCNKMKKLIAIADIITPNYTEACILLDEQYTNNPSITTIEAYAKRLCDMGAKSVIITGVSNKDKIYNVSFEKNTNTFHKKETKKLAFNVSGTGDIFASVICASVLNGMSVPDAVNKAADFVFSAIKNTLETKPAYNTVSFEPLLKNLIL